MEILPQRYLLYAALLLLVCSVASACRGTLLISGLSPGEREIILHEHNKLRQLVATGRYPGQPGAENMREMIWDDELAARAQQWADNCEFRHDPYRTINRFTMGQNLATIWSTIPLDAADGDFPSRIQSWFNEVQRYSFGDAWSPKTGHYSQLVWGETSLIGCGYSEYKDATKYNKLYVCNYGPGGNVVGYNPYEVGKPSCATYGLYPSSRYQGLCAPSVAPVVSANAIDTYDYNNNNNNNNQIPNYSTQNAASSSSSSSSSPSSYSSSPSSSTSSASSVYSSRKQASHTFNHRKTSSVQRTTYTTTIYNNNKARTATATATTSALQTATGGNKYKNKLEAYRPSTAEFQKSIQKHTILRSFLDKSNYGGKQQQQQQQHGGGADDNLFVSQQTTPQPIKRGWSLLTWNG